MEAEKVHLTKEKETFLITLYSRALHSREIDPVLWDEAAKEAIVVVCDLHCRRQYKSHTTT